MKKCKEHFAYCVHCGEEMIGESKTVEELMTDLGIAQSELAESKQYAHDVIFEKIDEIEKLKAELAEAKKEIGQLKEFEWKYKELCK